MLRIFKLGSLEHGISPTEESIKKLQEMLKDTNFKDIIWGPDIEVELVPETAEEVLALAKLHEKL
jgi:hypothetical protein